MKTSAISILTTMPQPLSALRKVKAFMAALFLLALESATAEDWYLSNAAGMTLEPLYSRFIALRERYCLSIDEASEEELPPLLLPYYNSAFHIELHTLYENGVQTRRQWIFKDSAGTTRLVSVFDEPASSGFIEVYNVDYLISEERQFAEDSSETFTGYFYNGKTLIRVETSVRAAPTEDGELSPLTLLTTDYYRYTRAASLRAVDRVYHTAAEDEVSGASGTGMASGAGTVSDTSTVSGTNLTSDTALVSDISAVSDTSVPAPAVAATRTTRLQFPRPGSAPDINFINPSQVYSASVLPETASSVSSEGIVFTTDERGRILTETQRDAEGTVVSETYQTWNGDRLVSVVWKSGHNERRTEFEYNQDNDRIMERNYNNDILERTVQQDGTGTNREIEELYLNGVPMLRAIWENGRKVSEERLR
ncbi:MAG: hypothetical protein LBK00_09805 [Treponema sp.]|jgi:hypothetical protein|nr:hypothetical protein [Treponema sp.]